MAAPVLRLDGVSLAFGSRPLLDNVTLLVEPGERVCVVGRNGEGKSSLMRLVNRVTPPDTGTVWVRPGAKLAFLAQDIVGQEDAPVREVVAGGLLAQSDHLEDWEIDYRVDSVLTRLGLDPDARYESLSGGWRRRALLGRALACEPELLLLDEPTNHLDITTIEWLEEFLLEFRGALLFVSHDRRFVNRLATRIIDLDRGQLSSWPGNYDAYAKKKAEQLVTEARENALFDKKLAQEEVWIRKGVEARRTRNEGRVRALLALRNERRERRERPGSANLQLQDARQSGKVVFEAEGAAVRFGDRTILRDFNTRILRGDRIGIVGPNGAGKSTLIRLLLGEIEPTAGTVWRGTKLEVAYYDQQRAQLDLTASVMENVGTQGEFVKVNGENRHVSGYLQDFLFRPEQLKTPAGALSGGERNRLLLARLFAQPANLLVLDEPTNDLDIDTLELLQELVADYAGTLLLVSHDREFLDNVVTNLLVLEGDGNVLDFVGGYGEYEAWRDERARRANAWPLAAAGTAATGAASAPSSTRPSPASTPAPAPAAKSAPKPRRSYKEQRELDSLPGQIETLETTKAALEAQAADPGFYAQPRDTVSAALARLAAITAEIDAKTARWLELEG